MARIWQVVLIPTAHEEALEQVERHGQLLRSLYPWPGEMLSLPGVLWAWIEDVMVLQRWAQNKKSIRTGRPELKHWQSLARLGNAGDNL